MVNSVPRVVLAYVKPSLLEIPSYSQVYSLSKEMEPDTLML